MENSITPIVQAISTVGFPIFMSCALFWYMVTENRETREVIQNNTTMLNRILEHMVGDEKRHNNGE